MDAHIARADGALPVSPDLPELATPPDVVPVDARTAGVALLAVVIAIGAGLVAQVLTALIALITNVAYYQRFSFESVSPGGAHLGAWGIGIPVLGALIIGVMARYGSAAIRGHGIPEVMERVLYGESRIPARIMILKPVSAAVAIGTGGPFGAEGPIIATVARSGRWWGSSCM
jgi:H+/Cl- antiporter ClcA